MEAILVLVLAVPLGRLLPSRKLAWVILAVGFLIVLPIQTASVRNDGHLDAGYWLVQAIIASVGAVLVVVGSRWRAKHETSTREAAPTIV